MSHNLTEMIHNAVCQIQSHVSNRPDIGIVLGSGWGKFAESIQDAVKIPYAQLPGFATASVPGHAGFLVMGRVGSTRVAALQGRFHYYEGHDLATTTFPIRVLARLGLRTVVLTAATGGIRPDLQPGDLVCLTDHINLIGANPLRGPHHAHLGDRFPDMSQVYDPELRALAIQTARRLGIQLKYGVYAAMAGPSYETPAEIRMLSNLGADVVGMSTGPEAIVARQMGLKVLGLALVTNSAAGLTHQPITHAEVLATGANASQELTSLLENIVTVLHH